MNVILSPNLKKIRIQLNKDGSQTVLKDETKTPEKSAEQQEIEALRAEVSKLKNK